MRSIPIKNMRGITENYLIKNNFIFYTEIFKINIDDDITLSERIWLYKNELNILPVCPNCKKNKLKFRNLNLGYRKFCSKKCSAEHSHKNDNIKQSRIKNMLKCNFDTEYRKTMTEKSILTKSLFSKEKKDIINNKRKNTVKKKYNVDFISQDKKIIAQIKKKIILTKKDNKDINFSNRISKIGYKLIKCEADDLKIKNIKCGHIFNIHRSLFNQRNRFGVTVCTICNPIDNHISDFQNSIKKFISSIYSGKIINNYKPNKYEIDIFLPDLNIGFECNGLWWHSELYKEKEYHINKLNYFKEKNIEIINIWEDNWKNKQVIVKSIILNKLNKTPNKIYARKTKIKEVIDNKLIRKFLDKNHLHGFVGSTVKLGLFFDNELVSLMTFGKRRIAMGKKSTNESEFELLRFCNKLNTNIIGGASKLFKYFIKNYKPKEITTYADRSYSNGKLYKILGFTPKGNTQANYYYFHKDIGIRLNRFNFRKDILIKNGYDKNKTESEIMKSRYYYKIYDCGNLRFKYIP